MPDSGNFGITVRRQEWTDDNVALLCGIANAGGGRIIVSSSTGSHARKMKRLRKSFEIIPRTARRELGIDCTTEPLVDGVDLCLEIQVPPAPTPLQYRGVYYLYSDDINTVVTRDLLERLWQSETSAQDNAGAHAYTGAHAKAVSQGEPSGTQDEAQGAQSEPDAQSEPYPQDKRTDVVLRLNALEEDGRPTFNDKSVAAANRLDLTSTDEYVLKVLRTNGRATAPRIADVLVVSESTVRRSFRKLQDCGLIERIGSRKAGYWRIVG